MLIDGYWAFEESGESCAVMVGAERQRKGLGKGAGTWLSRGYVECCKSWSTRPDASHCLILGQLMDDAVGGAMLEF